ncbi:MAG: type III-B CRISPR-associated protein Cas10/Cmr2 [Sphingobacteriales bacterium]|nr:type III-B CRISPR-associated protein Cas10/Cmr2 [Sphingobacteriales bacterium]
MSHYLALTIGPIYKTLLKAHSTREIWMSSYFFSVLMEYLYAEAKKYGDIILPTPPTQAPADGAGIYPDRLLMILDEKHTGINARTDIIDPALNKLSKDIDISLQHLKSYVQIHPIILSEEQLKSIDFKEKSPIHRLNHLLDCAELNPHYARSADAAIDDLFNWKMAEALNKKAYGVGRKGFPSILEISAQAKYNELDAPLKKLLNRDAEDELLNIWIATLPTHSKYIAILRADGDNLGQYIGSLGEDIRAIKNLSQKISDYSVGLSEEINKFGAKCIYIGGDDLLCFAPLRNHEGKTVFELIDTINKNSHQSFNDINENNKNKLSLSFGLSITYYKYPMNEALQLSYSLLFEKAKKVSGKNALAYQVLQHSGQVRDIELSMEKEFRHFIKLLDNYKDKELLQSVIHKFMEDEVTIDACLNSEHRRTRLTAYFDNHYLMSDKMKQEQEVFVAAARDLTLELHQKTEKNTRTSLQVNTILRTLKFLKNDEAIPVQN